MLEIIQKYPAGALAMAMIAVELTLIAWLSIELAGETLTSLFR